MAPKAMPMPRALIQVVAGKAYAIASAANAKPSAARSFPHMSKNVAGAVGVTEGVLASSSMGSGLKPAFRIACSASGSAAWLAEMVSRRAPRSNRRASIPGMLSTARRISDSSEAQSMLEIRNLFCDWSVFICATSCSDCTKGTQEAAEHPLSVGRTCGFAPSQDVLVLMISSSLQRLETL